MDTEVTTVSALQTAVNWLLGVMMTILGAIAAFYHKRFDDLEKGQSRLKETYVSREELERHLKTLAEQRAAMHLENTRKLERIEDSLRRVHDRIDAIPFRSHHARTRSSDPPLEA